MNLIQASLWIPFIAFEIWRNRRMRLNNVKPDYLNSFGIRGILAIVHGSLIVQVNNWSEALPVLGFQVASFYLVFDLALNAITGDKWNYQGKTSGYLDKLPMWAYIGLKVLCLVYLIWFACRS